MAVGSRYIQLERAQVVRCITPDDVQRPAPTAQNLCKAPMNRTLQALAAATLATTLTAVSANELTFDDLTGTVGFTAPYQGFTFAYTQGPRGSGCNCAGSWRPA